jgi:hypothetical protein
MQASAGPSKHACKSLLLGSLSAHFHKHPKQCVLLAGLIDGRVAVSLRVVDWFVTHYAQMRGVVYWVDDATNTYHMTGHKGLRRVDLYQDYRAQLRSYSKLLFDPFRRHERITFVISTTPLSTVETTVGQLNFFRWALQNCVLAYIQDHATDIEQHMAQFAQRKCPQRSPAPGGRRGTTSLQNLGYCHLRFD